MTSDRWLTAWTLGSVALGGASLLVPLYFVNVTDSAVLLGVLAGVAAAAGAPGALLGGRVADRTDRHRSTVVGTLMAVAAVLAVVALVRRPAVIIVLNGVLWLAAGAIAPTLNVLVTVGHPQRRWSERFAVLNVYGGWGWAAGLVLGVVWTAGVSLLTSSGVALRSLFVALSVAAGFGAVVAAERLPRAGAVDERRARRIARALRSARRVPFRGTTFALAPGRVYWLTRDLSLGDLRSQLDRPITLYLAAATLFFAGFGAFWGPLPLLLTGNGVSDGIVFALYLASSLAAALSYGWAGRLLDRHPIAAVQAAGLGGRGLLAPVVAVAIAAFGASLAGLVLGGVALAVMGITWALIAVTAATLVSALAPGGSRGTALGLYVAVGGVGNGVGAVLGGSLAARSFTLAFAVAGGLVLLGAAVVFWLGRTHDASVPASEDDPPAAAGTFAGLYDDEDAEAGATE